MATYDENKSYASSGVGTAGLTLGVIGTALASGLLNGGLGGLFNNQGAQKDALIAKLESQQYSDQKANDLAQRVVALETAAPLREQIILGKVQEVSTAMAGMNTNIQTQISGISATLASIVRPFVPNYALAPGYGPAFVAPLPPPVPPTAFPSVNAGTTGGTTDAAKAAA